MAAGTPRAERERTRRRDWRRRRRRRHIATSSDRPWGRRNTKSWGRGSAELWDRGSAERWDPGTSGASDRAGTRPCLARSTARGPISPAGRH
ncbi:MAG: hypothetical protein M0005_05200 [Actinomycetota bacterium]|nr:hypothetical protein [Actinomycetota bacterium]